MSKLKILKELWEFIKEMRKWFLVPVALLLLGALLITVQSSVVAPFIYTIF